MAYPPFIFNCSKKVFNPFIQTTFATLNCHVSLKTSTKKALLLLEEMHPLVQKELYKKGQRLHVALFY
jgi:hypothetical protein